MSITIEIPTGEASGGYRRFRERVPHYGRRLSTKQRETLAVLRAGLVEAEATLADGRKVTRASDVLLFMLDQAGDELDGE